MQIFLHFFAGRNVFRDYKRAEGTTKIAHMQKFAKNIQKNKFGTLFAYSGYTLF